MENTNLELEFLRLALEEGKKCIPTPTAFCVGCVITSPNKEGNRIVVSTGYSRELPGNTHAEANALTKLSSLSASQLSDLLQSDVSVSLENLDLDLYTTMEPCSVRTSGLPPCCDAIIASKVKRCLIGVAEPPDFVNCEGAQKVSQAGIQVIWLKGEEHECLRIARSGHTSV